VGWLAFAAATLALQGTPPLRGSSLGVRVAAAFAALFVTARSLPRLPPGPAAPRPRYDLALRLLATAALVVSLTGIAGLLGPSLSGLVTPFPVATTILVVFAHRESGAGGVVAVLGGFIPSLYSFVCFCASMSYGLARWPVPAALAAALLVSVVSQALVLWVVRPRA
jgi:hypothetical protein